MNLLAGAMLDGMINGNIEPLTRDGVCNPVPNV